MIWKKYARELERLERKIEQIEKAGKYIIYTEIGIAPRYISAQLVIDKILRHLGLRAIYHHEKPPTVELEKND